MKDKKENRILNARVSPEIYAKYEKQAKKERRKISQLVLIVIEDGAKKFN